MRRKTVIIGLGVLVLLGAAMLVMIVPSEEPIEVLGALSKREVRDIRIAVQRKIQPKILPDLSMQSLREAPGIILGRYTKPLPKIWRIEGRNREFAAVIARGPANPNGYRYVFWCVFKETNTWWAGDEYLLKEYGSRSDTNR